MAMGLNRVLLLGNLTKDPELRYTSGENPTAVCGMRLAVNGSEKRGGIWTDRADYFDVQVFGNQAESCAQYLGKGSKICVDGRLRAEEWTDKESGQKKYRTLIRAQNVQFLDKLGGGGGGSHTSAAFIPDENVDFGAETGGGESFVPAGTDDDIPF